MIFDSIRKLSKAIDSRITNAIDSHRRQSMAIAKSFAIGSIRLLAIAFAFTASATIETAPDWSESEPPIRFKSRDWADAVLAAASTNDSIAIEGGRLLSNTTWDATKTHLVFNTVYVPSGITLTISEGAVVKFCPGTTIKVEDGGKLSIVGASGNDVILTAANDATVGEVVAGLDDEPIAFDGIRLQSTASTFTDNSHLETRGFNYGAFPTVSVLGTEAVRNGGVAYVPFTLSGSSRETAFSVEWEAIEGTARYGDDYTLASGTISWGKSSEGTKTLQIPLNAENITGEERTFTVRIKAARCSNIGTRTATVKIVERDALTLEWAGDWAESEPPIRFKSRDWADAVLAAASTNSSIAIEGGRLLSNATWDSIKTHLVFNTVYVPSGVTLTISAGAVVKFCPGTMIKVEDGGKLSIIGASGNDVILTAANDATVGAVIAGFTPEQSIAFDGIRLQSSAATFTDNGWLETRGFNYGAYPSVKLNDSTAFRSSGLASIPVTISGTRDQTLTIDWVTVDDTAKYGEDYTLASGRITWGKASEGTKTISIPLVTTNIVGATTAFKIKIVTARGANIADGECTVSIREFDTLNIESGSAESTPPIRFKSRDWADAVLAAASTNSSIAIEGGRLLSNTTWNATKTHLVFNTVYVPSGVTLTISEGAVVKFCPGTTIKVEDGGKLNIIGASGNDVILTAANDATAGAVIAGFTPEQSIAFDGIRLQSTSATFTDNGWLETRGFNYGAYPNVTLHDATANRKAGTVYLPVTVGGTTRNQSFTVDWIAEDGSAQFGRDYMTQNSGRLTWSKSGDGTKYITIPLVTTEKAGTNRTFTVRFVVARGVNVSRGEATVTIAEFENGGITSMEVVEHAPSEASPEFAVDEGIGIQPIFLKDVEKVQYSGKWQTYDKGDATTLQVSVESDNGVKILKETAVTETGTVDLELADYPVGCYTLKHEILNALGETLATMSKTFSVADEEDVELHGGTLTENEVWSADKVHVVYQTVYVPSIYTLFIEPGAIVKFMTGTGIDISQGGALFANKIVFTHINDDTIGGDTLSDGYTVAPPMDAYTLSGNFTFGDDTELRGITQNNALTGTISTRKVLSRGSTYRVSGTLTIANGGSLTIPPGTVLKMEDKAAIVVNSGATLSAVGTRAAPIIITSIKDDSVSGDTNGDGDKTIPQPGDWDEIKNNGGVINLAFVSALYGGYGQYSNQGDAIIRTASGTTTMDCCVVMHSNLRLISRTGGTVSAVNCILQDGRWGIDGAVTFVNGVIADCNTGANGATVRNSILWECDTYASGGAISDCVCWGVDSIRPQTIAFNEASGNIWGDPLFVDPDNGDFRIQEGSPCVDAADSSVAPEFDYYGQPRITVTEQGTNTVGQLADIGICELMPRNVTSDIDLVPHNVRTVTNAVPGELLFVKWEVKNAGGGEMEGAWRDTVSLVSNNGREVVLGNKTTTGVIAPGGSIFCSGYFAVPPISEGEWYPKVNVNNYRDVFEGALGVNNALVGERALTVKAEALDPSVAREGVIGGGTPSVVKLTFGADDENRMVKFDVPAGVKVTWGFGFMPQGASQSGSMTATDGGVMFRVPEGATDVYVVLESDKTATYEMTTESTKMVITGVTPNTLPSSGTTTLVITGAGFGETNDVVLATATDSIRVQSTAKDASGNLIATVDCSTLTAGATYDVRVESGEKAAELDSAVTVTKAEGKGVLELEYDVPSSVRPGRVFSFTVTYRNIGNKDMCVPLLTVQDSGNDAKNPIQFSLDGERFTGGGFQFVGTDADGGFGPLRPGDEVTLQLLAKIPVGNNGSTAVSVRANTESDIMAKYTTEVDRYLTPSMKDEFANTADAELKAYGERLTQVFGANNGEMVQNFAALALKFYEDTEQSIQIIQDIVSLLPEITYNSSATTTYKICESSMKKSFFNLQRFASKGSSRTYTTNVKCYDSISGDVILSKNVGEQTDLWVWTGSWSKRLSESDIKLNDGEIAIICHGNCDSKSSGWMGEIASELAKTGKFVYILCVNWEDEVFYPQNDAEKYVEEAAYNIYPVAQFMKNELSKYSWIPENTTFIGHSFGSHLLGLVSGGRGLRHIGLDTAKTVPMLVSDNGRNSVINGSAAKKTEYYRTSPLYGRQDAYADENFIVCETGKFYFSGDNDNKHSYACKWFADNIASSEAKAAGVGFWRAYASNSAIDRCANKSGFMGVINGDNNSYEGIYPYSSPEKAYKIANFKYPGNQDGWQKMYDKWATVADYDITIETPFNKTFKLGVPRSVRLTLKDDCDITTTERIFQKQVLVYFKNGVTGQRYYLTEKRQMDNAFDINIRIPESYVRKGNLTADHSLIFRVSHGNGVLNEYRAYEDLYPDDNECIINNIRFEENDEPVAVINKYGEDDFTIEHKVPFDSYEDYVEAVEDGDTIEFEFDGSKSIGGGDKELTQFIWRNPDTDKVVGTKKTLTQTFYSTITAKYPISLTVGNEENQNDTVSGWLHIIPVDKRTGKKITQPTSYDPNEMTGPLGVGDPLTERFVKPGEWMTYTVYFENLTNATAAAQEVYVTNPLSEWLDWSTFEMGEIAFGDQIDLGLSGKSSGTTEKRMDGTNWIVRTELSIEPDTTATDSNRQQKMCAKWYLRIVDPSTDTGWPNDPVAGFLPPNNPDTHCGEGHITYRIKLRDDVPLGTKIENSATIVFDFNEPIKTDPSWWNIVGGDIGDKSLDVTFAMGETELNQDGNYIYDGTAKTPGVSLKVKVGSEIKTLAEGRDFKCTYYDNVNANSEGNYPRISIEAIGNYAGSIVTNFVIAPREVTLTSGSASKVYDGTALVNSTVTVGGDGFVDGEGVSYTYTGSQTEVGSSANAFSYTLKDNTKASNYTITTANGTLTVTKASVGGGTGGGAVGNEEPGAGEVPQGGVSKFDASFAYDGEGHTIDTNAITVAFGSAMVGESAIEYAVDDGSVGGGCGAPALPWLATTPVYTNAGEYIVWYRVTNPNYNDFTHAAKLTITPRTGVVVDIVGNIATNMYNGAAQCIDGYTVAINDSLYKETDFEFAGNSAVSGTAAGKYPMGLIASQFTNKNMNFAGVTFNVTDGELVILEPPQKNVIFDAIGGSFADGAVVTQECEDVYITFPVATREGYVFDGWYLRVTNGAPKATVGAELLIDDDHTLFAKWKIGDALMPGGETVFAWEAIDANTARITGFKNAAQKVSTLLLPDMMEGRFVTEIAAGAFANSKSGMTKLILPVFCTKIGDKAFTGVASLSEIVFADVRRWDAPSEIGSLAIGRYAFSGAGVGAVTLPKSVGSIGDYVFANCRKLTNLTILGAPTVGVMPLRRAGLDVGGVTVHLDPALANDGAYMEALKQECGNVTVRADAVVTRMTLSSLAMSASEIELLLSVEKAASWGKVDLSLVKVAYRESLSDAPTMLDPSSVTENADGSLTVKVVAPKGNSGFFQVVLEK